MKKFFEGQHKNTTAEASFAKMKVKDEGEENKDKVDL
jgi:hypothetical protein